VQRLVIGLMSLICVSAWANAPKTEAIAVQEAQEAKPEPSSCVVIVGNKDSGVVDRAILSLSSLAQYTDSTPLYDAGLRGKISSVVEVDYAGEIGPSRSGFDDHIIAGTEKGQVLFLPTQSLRRPNVTPLRAGEQTQTRADEVRGKAAATYRWDISELPISNISVYFDTKVNRNIIVPSSERGTRTIKIDDPAVYIHDIGARQALDVSPVLSRIWNLPDGDVKTPAGVVGIYPKDIRRFSNLGLTQDDIVTTIVAKAEHKITAGDISAATGAAAILDGDVLKLVDARGDVTPLMEFKDGEHLQYLKFSPQGNRLAIKTTNQLMILISAANGEIEIEAVDMPGLVGDVKWSATGTYLAVSNFESVTIFNVDKRTGKEIQSTHGYPSLQRLFWLSADDVLMTVSAEPAPPGTQQEGVEGAPEGLWLARFWHADDGEQIRSLSAAIPMATKNETPPYIVNVSGRLYHGTLKFMMLTEEGHFSNVEQTLRPKPQGRMIYIPRARTAGLVN